MAKYKYLISHKDSGDPPRRRSVQLNKMTVVLGSLCNNPSAAAAAATASSAAVAAVAAFSPHIKQHYQMKNTVV